MLERFTDDALDLLRRAAASSPGPVRAGQILAAGGIDGPPAGRLRDVLAGCPTHGPVTVAHLLGAAAVVAARPGAPTVAPHGHRRQQPSEGAQR